MKRRQALIALGTLIAGLAGRRVVSAEEVIDATPRVDGFDSDMLIDTSTLEPLYPADYVFMEDGLGKLIIERTSGARIEIPFSEIFDALEGKEG